jgi:ferredoxin-NADP reductase
LVRDQSAGTRELLNVRVAARETVSDGVVSLSLTAADGGGLPAWTPGSHVDLVLSESLVRQYSLCGDPGDGATWRLGVLREKNGRGGSAYIHDRVEPGDVLQASAPRNHFVLSPAPSYLFIAGGIGVTPLLPMAAAAEDAGADWRLFYGGRRRRTMAFLDEVARYGDRVVVLPEDEVGQLDLPSLLGRAEPDTLVYCCGPEPLLAAVEEEWRGRPSGNLRVERFRAAAPSAEPMEERSFEMVLTQTGVTVTVGPGESVLEAAEEAGAFVLYSCSEGTCGSCETPVLEGLPDHRDLVLSDQQRRTNDRMMICVSRCLSDRLVLDL